jgi:hypothetical protein
MHQNFISYLICVPHRRVDFFIFISASKLIHKAWIVLRLGGDAAICHTRVAVLSLKIYFVLLSLDSFSLSEKTAEIRGISELKCLVAFSKHV